MKREVFFDAAGRRDELQAPVHYLDRGHRKDLFRPGKTFVFVQNRQRHGQQLDLVFGTCLQPVARDPPIARSILFELFPYERPHVRMADARKAGEEKHIPRPHLALMTQRCGHQALQLLVREVSALDLRRGIAVEGEGIAGHPAVVEGRLDHVLQAFKIIG